MGEPRLVYLQELNYFIKESKNCIKTILNVLSWREETLTPSEKAEPLKEASLPIKLKPVDLPQICQVSHIGKTKEPNGGEQEKIYQKILLDLVQPMKDDQEKKEKTFLEELAEKRDAKRRRMSYKNKVHTKNKSQTEILREVIGQQMEMLEGDGASEEKKGGTDEEVKQEQSALQEVDSGALLEGNPYSAWMRIKQIIDRSEELATKRQRRRVEEERRGERQRKKMSVEDERRDNHKRRRESGESGQGMRKRERYFEEETEEQKRRRKNESDEGSEGDKLWRRRKERYCEEETEQKRRKKRESDEESEGKKWRRRRKERYCEEETEQRRNKKNESDEESEGEKLRKRKERYHDEEERKRRKRKDKGDHVEDDKRKEQRRCHRDYQDSRRKQSLGSGYYKEYRK